MAANLKKPFYYSATGLVRGLPFLVGDKFTYIHKPFTLVTDNRPLYDLLTHVRVDKYQVEYLDGMEPLGEADEKALVEVLRILNSHLLFRIGFKLEQEVLLQYAGHFEENEHVFQQYYNLDWENLLRTLSDLSNASPEPVTAQLCTAYYYYRTRQYLSAARLLSGLRKISDRMTPLQKYTVAFNLHFLGRFLQLHPNTTAETIALVQECQSIRIEEAIPATDSPGIRQLVAYVQETRFVHGPYMDMTDQLETIRRLYLDQSSGYTRSADHLMEDYYQTSAFLSGNYLIYDQFSEFYSFTRVFMQGLFLSVLSSPLLAGRVQHLNDAFVTELILQGRGEDFVQWANEHHITAMPYARNGDRPPFYRSLGELLTRYASIHASHEETLSGEAPFLSHEIDRILLNGLLFASYCELPEKAASDLFDNLITFLQGKIEPPLRYLQKGIVSFLSLQRANIRQPQWSCFLSLLLSDPALQEEDYVETFCSCLKALSLYLPLSSQQVDSMESLLAGTTEQDRRNWVIYCTLYDIVEEGEAKKRLQTIATTRSKKHFSGQIYYLTRILDVLSPDIRLTDQYTEEIMERVRKGPVMYAGTKSFYIDYSFNQFINFCWKFDLPLPTTFVEYVRDFGPYYNWLTDMEHFDYKQFNPKWLTVYFTLHFKKTYRKSAKLKQEVLQRMRIRRSLELERFVAVTYGDE